MTLPNFFIVGAAKSGTTSLVKYLSQHPDIYFPELKEPNYFAFPERPPRMIGPVPEAVLKTRVYNWTVTSGAEYRALFDGVRDERAVGEASVRYLYSPTAADSIHAAVPAARIVIILRDPVRRIWSHYNMNRQFQLEPLDIEAALEAEPDRIADGWGWDWHYAAVSRYAEQVARYVDRFGRSAVAIFFYDDFVADPLGTIRAICRHVGVSEAFEPDMRDRGKVARRLRSLRVDRFLHWPHPVKDALFRVGLGPAPERVIRFLDRLNSRPAPPADARLRAIIARHLTDETDALSEIIGKDVPWA